MKTAENRVYIVAGVHPKNGVVLIDNGSRYTLPEAEQRAKNMNAKFEPERRVLGFSMFVAFNTEAQGMRPPYAIDMEKEWSFVVDKDLNLDEKLTITNNHSEGSKTWH